MQEQLKKEEEANQKNEKVIEKVKEESKIVETKLKKERVANDKLNDGKDKVQAVLDKLKKPTEAIDSTLSCLSCLTFLSEPKPLTLTCGHSICNNVSHMKFLT